MNAVPAPVVLVAKCPCGMQAKRAIAAVFRIGDKDCTAAMPVCEACFPRVRLLRVGPQEIPTHEPFEMRKAAAFPPSRGEVFVPALVVGCPACGQMGGLDRAVFSVTEEGITPSFICQCGFHGWLKWGAP